MDAERIPTSRPGGSAGPDTDLQGILDAVEDDLVVVDSDYRVKLVNAAARRKFGGRADSLFGGHCYEVLHGRKSPCSRPLWDCPLEQALASGRRVTVVHIDRADTTTVGADRTMQICAYPLRDSYGKATAIVELRRDISAERELETQVLKRHQELQALNHISSVVSGLWDLDEMLNTALDTLLNLTGDAIGGILLLDTQTDTLIYRAHRGLSPEFVEGIRLRPGEGILGTVAQTGEPLLLEDISQDPRTARPDLVGPEDLKAFVSVPLQGKDQVLGVMHLASRTRGRFGPDDVSLLASIGRYLGTAIEEVGLYERLERARERYQALVQHALTAQEEERRRIARELHDETSQAMTSLTLNLQALIGMAELRGLDEEFVERLKKVHAYAVHAGTEVVALMKELRPTLLDELGLTAAVHRYAKDSLDTRGVDLTTEFIGADEGLPPEVEISLFRIAQGAIGNILEHSAAHSASVKIVCDENRCVLQVEDDGAGFNVDEVKRVERSGRGAGLFTMEERARLVGGSFRVDSKPGRGTKIEAVIPLERDIPGEEDTGVGG